MSARCRLRQEIVKMVKSEQTFHLTAAKLWDSARENKHMRLNLYDQWAEAIPIQAVHGDRECYEATDEKLTLSRVVSTNVQSCSKGLSRLLNALLRRTR